jgi:hypothetical protein
MSLAAFAQVPVPPISGNGNAGEAEGDRPYSPLRHDSTGWAGLEGSSYLSAHIGLSSSYDFQADDASFVPNASVTLVHRASRSDTEVAYTGGGVIYAQESALNSQFHNLALTETFQSARWQFSIANQFSYSPQSSYGNSAFGGIPSQLIPILEALLPNQSFLQQGGQQYMDGVMVNASRSISRKFSVHGGFVYSLLQYIDSGLIGLQGYQGSGGLSRQIGRDSIAVDYSGSLTNFTGSSSMVSNKLAISYTHPFKNRAVLVLGVGPEAVLLRNPGQADVNKTIVDGNASFSWKTRGLDANLSYSHGAGSGGGLLQGSEIDTATVSVSRRVARIWTVGLHDGFSNVSQLSSLLSTGKPTSYRSIYAGCSVFRNIGRAMTFNFGYNFQYQTQSQQALSATTYRRNQVMAGLTYNLRPISLR